MSEINQAESHTDVKQTVTLPQYNMQIILQHVSDIVWIVDEQFTIKFETSSTQRIMGYESQYLVGRTGFELIHPDDCDMFGLAFDEVLQMKNTYEPIVSRFLHAQGHWITLEMMANNLMDDPEVHGIIVTARDITNQRETEFLLQQSQKKLAQVNQMFKLVLDTIPVRVFWKDNSLRYLGCNQKFAADAGVASPDQLIGANDFELAWKNEAADYQSDDKHVMDSGQPKLNYEESQITPDGKLLCLRTSKIPLRDVDGSILGILGTYEDITENKRYDSERRKLISIMENSADFIGIASLQSEIVYINEAGLSLLGISHFSDVQGKNIFEILPAESHKLIQETILPRLMRDEIAQGEIKIPNIQKQKVIDVEFTVFLLKDEYSKKPINRAIIMRDITEQKQFENTIIQSQNFYRSVIENAAGVPYRMIFGETLSQDYFEFIGERISSLLSIDQSSFDLQWFRGSIIHIQSDLPEITTDLEKNRAYVKNNTIQSYRADVCIKSGSGQKKWISDNALPICNNGTGDVIGMMGIFQDITERKKVEAALRESEDRFRQLTMLLPQTIYEADINGKLTYANNAAFKTFGYSLENLNNGLNCLNFIAPEDRVRGMENIQRILNNVDIGTTEYTAVRKNGDRFPVLMHSTANYKGKRLVGFRGIIIDMTDIRKTQIALKESQERFRALVQHLTDMIWISDEKSRIKYITPSCHKIIGYSQAQLIGKFGFDFMHEDDIRALKAAVGNAFGQNKISTKPLVFRIRHAKGHYVHMEAIISNMVNEEAIDGILFSARDITERKQGEQEKKRLEEQLQQAQKMEAIGQLAGGVAHDFNNLLIAILGNAELVMADLPENSYLYEDVKEIEKAAEKAAALTRQLLAFSRRQPIQTRKLDVNVIVKNMEKLLKRLIGEDITLVLDLGMNLPPLKADPGQIEQVIMNLAVNARDAMLNGGQLSIQTLHVVLDEESARHIPEARAGRFDCLRFQDTGTGMDTKIINQIFEPFFSTKVPGEGTGLGLAVVYGVIKQHNGWINVESVPGEGTVFSIYLPVNPGQMSVEPAEKLSNNKIVGMGERILFVEDDEEVRKLTLKILMKHGYQVDIAKSVAEALHLYDEADGDYDLVFSDVVLPDQTGIQLADQLLQHNASVNILLCSGYTEQKSQWNTIREKGFPFIQKPYSVNDLLKMINKIMHQVNVH
ncbi:PAS domain S-box protein [candidate division KSB1 bacterium]|nr:PAS domain S-box protein [candidate division KSB1 bacterium]